MGKLVRSLLVILLIVFALGSFVFVPAVALAEEISLNVTYDGGIKNADPAVATKPYNPVANNDFLIYVQLYDVSGGTLLNALVYGPDGKPMPGTPESFWCDNFSGVYMDNALKAALPKASAIEFLGAHVPRGYETASEYHFDAKTSFGFNTRIPLIEGRNDIHLTVNFIYGTWEGSSTPEPPQAIWYTVSFDSAGGSAVAAKSVTNGAVLGALPTPARAGYAFDGWYSAAGAKVSASTPVTASMTLTARWTATHAFLISLKVPGGKFSQVFKNNTFTYTVKLPKKKASTTVSVVKQNKKAIVEFKIGGKWKKVTSQKVGLKPGKSTTVTIRVKQAGLKTATYKVKVSRAK